MKKIKIVIIALFLSFAINAISQEKKVEFGVAGGYGLNIPKLKNTNTINLRGFHAGGLLTFNANEMWGIQTGLLYNHFSGIYIDVSQQNLKKSLGVWEQTKTIYSALDIPLNAVYSYMLADEFYLQLFAGPNFNYSLSKTDNKERYVERKISSNTKGENIYDMDTYSKFDLQMGAGIGIQWMGIGLRGTYNWGILNRTSIAEYYYRANDLKVTVSYKF